MDWLDAHAGSVQAMATLVLVVLTGYYAWASRALVRETRAWLGTLDTLMQRRYIAGFWQQVRPHYNASFQEFVDRRLRLE